MFTLFFASRIEWKKRENVRVDRSSMLLIAVCYYQANMQELLIIMNHECLEGIELFPSRRCMCAWEFLSKVIVPHSNGLLRVANGSVNAEIGFCVADTDGVLCKMFVFDYKNRMVPMEKVLGISSHGILIVKPMERRAFVGNASKYDRDCSVCLNGRGNFMLEQCGHWFHDTCLVNWKMDTCPVCRKEHFASDMERLTFSLLDGFEKGKIVAHLVSRTHTADI